VVFLKYVLWQSPKQQVEIGKALARIGNRYYTHSAVPLTETRTFIPPALKGRNKSAVITPFQG
jgi:hypothetical protein